MYIRRRTSKDSRDDGCDSESVNIAVQIKSISPSPTRKKFLQRQACSVDTGTCLMEPLIPLQKLQDSPRRKSITCSTPNLSQLEQPRGITHGQATIGRLRRSCVAVAPMSQSTRTNVESTSPQLLDNRSAMLNQGLRISSRQMSFDNILSQRSLTLLRMSSRRSLRSLQSLSATSSMNDSDLSCWQTVEYSQRLRHARYARRTSHSHEEAVTRIHQIMRGASLDVQRRTKSLPRASTRKTLSSETTREIQERSQMDPRMEFPTISPSGSEIVPRTRGRAAYLSSLARNYSDDVATKRARLLHPQIVKLSQDGSVFSRSSDGSRGILNRSLSRESSRSYVLEREATLDSVRECSESGHTSSSEESLMKNSSGAVDNK